MEVTVLAIPDCPNAPVLEQRLAEALAGRPGVTVRHIEIIGLTAAARHGMHGSPTLLVKRSDPVAPPGKGPALTCPPYRGHDGKDGRGGRAASPPAPGRGPALGSPGLWPPRGAAVAGVAAAGGLGPRLSLYAPPKVRGCLDQVMLQLDPGLRDLIAQTQAAVDSALLSHRV